MARIMRWLLSRRLGQVVFRATVLRVFMLRERLRSGVSYNPFASSLHADPYPTYRRLREKDPVHRSAMMGGWVLTRHADVDAVLRDDKRFGHGAGDRRFEEERRQMEALAGRIDLSEEDLARIHGREPSMLALDPPDHTRLRSLVNRAFTPRSVEEMRPRIEAIVDELLDDVAGQPRFNVMTALAAPLPTIVIAEMLGVPAEDRDRFRAWSDDAARTLEPTITPDEWAAAIRASVSLDGYFDRVIEQRRVEPRGDLLSALIAAEEEGDKLSHPEMLSTLGLLLVAGNETTTNLIGNGLLALLRHPQEMQRLRDHPDLMERAVEELLRYDSPVQTDGRMALEDIEIGGQLIERGQQTILLLGAANHDPEAFPDPDKLDFTRDNRDHLSFARGIHYCLGAPLARLEGQIAFRKLLERFSDIRLAETPQFKDHIVLRGMHALWVEVEPASSAARPAAVASATA